MVHIARYAYYSTYYNYCPSDQQYCKYHAPLYHQSTIHLDIEHFGERQILTIIDFHSGDFVFFIFKKKKKKKIKNEIDQLPRKPWAIFPPAPIGKMPPDKLSLLVPYIILSISAGVRE